jgi:hypothetical protein
MNPRRLQGQAEPTVGLSHWQFGPTSDWVVFLFVDRQMGARFIVVGTLLFLFLPLLLKVLKVLKVLKIWFRLLLFFIVMKWVGC